MATGPTGRVTLRQVAETAGVSVMTASYTYNQPERVSSRARAQVLDAAARLGYAGPDPSARALRLGSSNTIAVVLGEHLSYAFDDPGAVSFMAGVADVCAAEGAGMLIVPVTGGEDDITRVTDAAADGFIVWTTTDDDPVLTAVRATGRPAVLQGRTTSGRLLGVTIDNRAAARAVGTLAFAHARYPAVLSQPVDRARVSSITTLADPARVPFPVTRHRLLGFRKAAADAGFDWDRILVAVCSRNSTEEAEAAARTLLTQPKPPDAIAAMSDAQAIGVLHAARALGLRVPADLAVTGFDDLAAAAEYQLTTVAQSLRKQGDICARIALGHQVPRRRPSWAVVQRATTRT